MFTKCLLQNYKLFPKSNGFFPKKHLFGEFGRNFVTFGVFITYS